MAIVVDASIALRWVVEEDGSGEARFLRDEWLRKNEEVLAPPIFRSELVNGLYRQVRIRTLPVDEATQAYSLLESSVIIHEPVGLGRRALELAFALRLPAAYDAFYLALADLEGCELWTADRRLAAVASSSHRVRWLGEVLQ